MNIVATGFLYEMCILDINIYNYYFIFNIFKDHEYYGTLIFYWLPTCGILTANLILFLLTVIHYSRIKSELNKFRQTDSKTEIFLVYKAR